MKQKKMKFSLKVGDVKKKAFYKKKKQNKIITWCIVFKDEYLI